MAWSQDYGNNLWPNGTSEVPIPQGADPNSPEWNGISTDIAFRGTHSRKVVDPANSGAGHYTEIVLANIPATQSFESMPPDADATLGEWYYYSAMVNLAEGSKAEIWAVGVDANGSVVSMKYKTLTTFNQWNRLSLAYDPYPPVLTPVANISFTLRVYNNTVAGIAYFDDIVLKRIQRTVPSGTILPWAAGATGAGVIGIPPGFLPCDGSTFAYTDYPTLANAIYGAWNNGNTPPSGQCRLPDLRGRVPLGVGSAPGLSSHGLAQCGGEENHTLSVAEMPAHTHPLGASPGNYGSGAYNLTNGYSSNIVDDGYPVKAQARSVGGSAGHNNMQPYASCLFIIAI